jgi:hypothetical protein
LGGKNDLINVEKMNNLFVKGCEHIELIKESLANMEQIVSELRKINLVGEKGLVCRQALNSISVLTNDISRTAEKASIFMEAKINKQKDKKECNNKSNANSSHIDIRK